MLTSRKILSPGFATNVLLALAAAAIVCLSTSSVSQTSVAKAVGTVKSVNGNTVVVTTDSGAESTVTFSASPRIVRAEPGQTDVKSMTAIQVSDIQPGDRIIARGQTGDNGAIATLTAIVMKKSDVAEKQQTENEAWRRGVGGIVKSVDSNASAIVIANSLAASGKLITVQVTPQTQISRYAPDSVKFDDAKAATLDQIKPGDQLRARGSKNADGTEFSAQAIVCGSFRNLAGTVISTDAANHSLTVMDLATKKPMTVNLSGDSQLRQLPQPMAMRLAMRLKGGSPPAAASGVGQGSPNNNASAGQGNYGAGGGHASGNESGGMQGGQGYGRGGGSADFQQILSRMPAVSLADLKKGDAVMVVATEGTDSSQPTVITLLTGVEPILTASPTGAGAAMILSPWNLGGGGMGGGDAATQ